MPGQGVESGATWWERSLYVLDVVPVVVKAPRSMPK
jgi:hypothetical protein